MVETGPHGHARWATARAPSTSVTCSTRPKALPPDCKFDVVFLAPACTFDFMAKRLPVFREARRNLRMFALTDENERGYWEVPVLYRGSLLYLVSGLCEDEVDNPILGMQRYHERKGTVRAEEHQGRGRVSEGSLRLVDCERRAGVQSGAVKHGAFDDDPDAAKPRAHPRERLLTYGRRGQEGPRAHRRNQQATVCRSLKALNGGSPTRDFNDWLITKAGVAEKTHQGHDLRQKGRRCRGSRHRGQRSRKSITSRRTPRNRSGVVCTFSSRVTA